MKTLVVTLLLIASSAYGEIYTWTDARGTAHYTNSYYDIPARYLPRAKVIDIATGKKNPVTAAPPSAPAQPAGGAPAPSAGTGAAAPPPAVPSPPPAGVAPAIPPVPPVPQPAPAGSRRERPRRSHVPSTRGDEEE